MYANAWMHANSVEYLGLGDSVLCSGIRTSLSGSRSAGKARVKAAPSFFSLLQHRYPPLLIEKKAEDGDSREGK